MQKQFFPLSNLNQNKNDLNLRIQMMPVYCFSIFSVLLGFFPSLTSKKYLYGRRTILLVVMSVHFYSIYIMYFQPGKKQLSCFRLLLKSIWFFGLHYSQANWSAIGSTCLFSVNFTWSLLIQLKAPLCSVSIHN